MTFERKCITCNNFSAKAYCDNCQEMWDNFAMKIRREKYGY